MGRGLLRAPLCALLRHAGLGPWGQVQPPPPLPCRRSSCGWGRPPGPGGAEGRALWLPSWGGCGGGGGGGHPACSRACVGGGGGGEWGAVPAPGASHRPGGVAPFPRPPLPSAGSSRSPSLGPLISRPLPRGAGRPGVAVRVSGQWLAGGGAAFPG